MDDKDVARLEDRIAATGRESDLKLAAAIARMDARFDQIAGSNAELKAGLSQVRTELSEVRSATRVWGQWVIATVIGVGFGLAALAVGLGQVWIGGVQVGQASQAHAASAPPSH